MLDEYYVQVSETGNARFTDIVEEIKIKGLESTKDRTLMDTLIEKDPGGLEAPTASEQGVIIFDNLQNRSNIGNSI